MRVISLTTDFGMKDGNVGAMKGVILKICPEVQIADLSHLISPQNIAEAALIVSRAAPYFPQESVHIIVVDPGVGTARRPIAARLGDQLYVAPDNGVLTPVLEKAEMQNQAVEIVYLDRPEYWLPTISNVFHGRDIFAPSGAHLACGVPLNRLGTAIHDPVRIEIPRPEQTGKGLRGQVIHIDHFGNIHTNILEEHLKGETGVEVEIGKVRLSGLGKTFGELPPGELGALFGSSGNLIIAVTNGNAARQIGAEIGEEVRVNYRPGSAAG